MLRDFWGTRTGRFFGFVPDYVDRGQPPGFSAIPTPSFVAWLRRVPILLLATPNGVWAAIALAFYIYFPYDLSPTSSAAASPLSIAFLMQRLPLWAALVFGYYGYWQTTLYALSWAERPFISGRTYNVDKTCHNMLWSAVGVVVWVCVENVFAYLWATGRLSYIEDSHAFRTPAGAASFIAALLLVPAWRDVHVRLRRPRATFCLTFVFICTLPLSSSSSHTGCFIGPHYMRLCIHCTTVTPT